MIKTKRFLIHIRLWYGKFFAYDVETDNIYRILGKIYSTTLDAIIRMDFTNWSEAKEKYLKEHNIEIVKFKENKLIYEN